MDSKRIKFLVFSASYPYRGGISDSTHSLCNELTKNNIETEVWTFSLLYPNFLFPGKTQFSNEVYEQNFKVKRIINTISLFNWIKVSKKVNKINPEVLILRYWSPILYLQYFFIGLFLKKKIKVVGLVDNWDNHEKLPFERFFRYLFISTCNYFISFSKNIGNTFASIALHQVCCPRLSIDWGHAFAAPLLTPYECEIALGCRGE